MQIKWSFAIYNLLLALFFPADLVPFRTIAVCEYAIDLKYTRNYRAALLEIEMTDLIYKPMGVMMLMSMQTPVSTSVAV